MLDLLNDIAGPMDELKEAADEAGLGDQLGILGDANDALQKAIDENGGIPDATFRFLHYPPDPSHRPSSSESTADLATQAGHTIDNLAGGPGFGKLGAAFANDKLLESGKNKQQDPLQWEFDHARWAVDSFKCEEGLNQLFRCEVVLLRPSTIVAQGAYGDPFQQMLDSWDPTNTKAGNALVDPTTGTTPLLWKSGGPLGSYPVPDFDKMGIGRDYHKAKSGTETFLDEIEHPDQNLAKFADVEDPDQLHPLAYLAHTILDPVDPMDFLGQPCRLGIARRTVADKFTLSERWISGVGVEFEDLGVRYKPGFRAVRVVFVPRLAQLARTRRYRIFQDKTALEIVAQILKEYQLFEPKKETTYADKMKGILRLHPPPKQLGGVLGVPSAATALAEQAGSLVDSVGKVFGASTGVSDAIGGALRDSLDEWGNKREYCVQYGETDLDFVNRLLAEEGVSYFFESQERSETLVLADDAFEAGKKILTLRRLPLASRRGVPDDPGLRFLEIGWNHEVGRRLSPSSVTLRDFNMTFARSCTDLQAGEIPPGLGGGLGVGALLSKATSLVSDLGKKDDPNYAGYEAKWFEYPTGMIFLPDEDAPLWPGAKYKSYSGAALAQIRLDRMRAVGALTTGGSNCSLLNPGHNLRIGLAAFDVLKEDDVFDAKTGMLKVAPRYLITRVVHEGGLSKAYRNSFEGVHIKLRYRPAHAEKPRIGGVHSATVIGVDMKDSIADGKNVPEPQVDKCWRVLVRFPWDTRKPNGDAAAPEGVAHSCWIRIGQGWAGAGYGALFAPRVGMEVLVGFENGDPDRPYVIGTLYNGHVESANDNTFHPYRPDSLKPKANESDAQNVGFVWSQSWPAAREVDREKQKSNHLWFNDNRGIEQVVLHAQRDFNEKIERDQITTVLANQKNDVHGKQEEMVAGDQKLYVNYPSKLDDPLDIGRDVEIDGKEEISVGKDGQGLRREKIKGHEERTIEKDRKEAVLETEVLLIEGKGDAPASDPDGGSKATPASEGPARPAPARMLTVHGTNVVNIKGNDELKVSGDREENVVQQFEISAQKIAMVIANEQNVPEDQRSGLRADPSGVHAGSQGQLKVEAPNVRVVSDDTILVSALSRIRLEAGENNIILDGHEGTITIFAENQGGIRIGTQDSFLELKQRKFKIQAGEASVEGDTTDQTDARVTLRGTAVTLNFAGEIHFNAHNATRIQHAADSVDADAQKALDDYRKASAKYDEIEKKSWDEIAKEEGIPDDEQKDKPPPEAPKSDDDDPSKPAKAIGDPNTPPDPGQH